MPKASDPRPADLQASSSSFDASIYEQANVHDVYENIARHFSSTRYKPWPLIPRFLSTLPPGSVGADLGCGNGKYLPLFSTLAGQGGDHDNEDGLQGGHLISLGMDRSTNLVSLAQHNFLDDARKQGNQLPSSIAHQRRNEVAVGDALLSNYRTASLDYALSIATIHHFSTPARRVASIAELIRIIRPVPRSSLPSSAAPPASEERGEQGEEGRGPGLQNCSTGRFLVFVWALEQRGESRRKFDENGQPGEGDERQDLLVPWVLKSPGQAPQPDSGEEKVHQRYYHVFKSGELEDLVREAALSFPHLRIHREVSGWERGNWYGVWQCIDETR
ncbi:hypothetical protein FA10DRAFT_280906 [Acaromyces ingoldii]|uniref:S-adenosyl-L-methionine-dependent methyltransferase n=1 Tax=Acaromyces ingoldii TaxID=215250 RepID=A0A316YFN0_9BASI|nr:hypothetical protein FA10DRAFT_280906 [Acaromyces ingoldii]PWN88360.1 hypothetical protein FA10DRAFT_280906 [Acaromyces ingoldii]